jgi:hypothetical protein
MVRIPDSMSCRARAIADTNMRPPRGPLLFVVLLVIGGGIVAAYFALRYPPGLRGTPVLGPGLQALPPKGPPYFLLLCIDADGGCVPEYRGAFPTAAACREQVHAIQAQSHPAAPEDKFVCTTNGWTLEPPQGTAHFFLSMEQCERVKDAVLAATPRTGPPVLRPDVMTGELIDVNAPRPRMCLETARLPAPDEPPRGDLPRGGSE